MMKIKREWAMPNKNTFSILPIKKMIETYYKEDEKWLNPFANTSKYGITNDIDDEIDTNFSLDALEFLKLFDNNSIDGILFDPPFSPRQVSECYKKMGRTVNYQDTSSAFWSKLKNEISRIVKPDGIVITFGWNSGGIGKTNDFEIKEILLVAHGGWHNDTICTVEVKNNKLELF